MPVDVSGPLPRYHWWNGVVDVTSPRGESSTPDHSHQREGSTRCTGPSASTGPDKEKIIYRTWYVLAVSSNRK
jgi:hypothetical protein